MTGTDVKLFVYRRSVGSLWKRWYEKGSNLFLIDEGEIIITATKIINI